VLLVELVSLHYRVLAVRVQLLLFLAVLQHTLEAVAAEAVEVIHQILVVLA
jgi:hypothetical protein